LATVEYSVTSVFSECYATGAPYESNMAKRKTYHVTSDGEGGWRVKAEGASLASSTHENKEDAVQRAKDLAKVHPLG